MSRPRTTRLLALTIPVLSLALAGPAAACLCNCTDGARAVASPVEHDQVFAGLTIWSERAGPLAARSASADVVEVDPGYWVRSRVLVLRTWRGTPAVIPQVWTPVATSCDKRPVPGTYFVARVTFENGRSVARSSHCDCFSVGAGETGRGSLSLGGVSIGASAIALVAVLSFGIFRSLRRRRSPG